MHATHPGATGVLKASSASQVYEGLMKFLAPVFLTALTLLFCVYLAMATIYVAREGEPETVLVAFLTAAGLPPALYGVRAAWRDARRVSPDADTFD